MCVCLFVCVVHARACVPCAGLLACGHTSTTTTAAAAAATTTNNNNKNKNNNNNTNATTSSTTTTITATITTTTHAQVRSYAAPNVGGGCYLDSSYGGIANAECVCTSSLGCTSGQCAVNITIERVRESQEPGQPSFRASLVVGDNAVISYSTSNSTSDDDDDDTTAPAGAKEAGKGAGTGSGWDAGRANHNNDNAARSYQVQWLQNARTVKL